MDGRCKTCKWWGTDPRYRDFPIENATSSACFLLADKGKYQPNWRPGVPVIDGGNRDMSIDVLTPADFGCTLHEPKLDDFPNET